MLRSKHDLYKCRFFKISYVFVKIHKMYIFFSGIILSDHINIVPLYENRTLMSNKNPEVKISEYLCIRFISSPWKLTKQDEEAREKAKLFCSIIITLLICLHRWRVSIHWNLNLAERICRNKFEILAVAYLHHEPIWVVEENLVHRSSIFCLQTPLHELHIHLLQLLLHCSQIFTLAK